jgi:lipid-binding SYLF domain-containing protein
MKLSIGVFLAVSTAALATASTNDVIKRLDTSARVLDEVLGSSASDSGIPRDLLDRAVCVGIIPGLKKAGFIVGGEYGKGFLVCRDTRNRSGRSGPSAVKIDGGSFGAQIGGGETDVILVVLNKEGARKLMQSEFTLGADAGVMAGPVGRDASAQTDALMHAQILSYSRSRGAFAGVTLNGATLRDDKKANEELYGKPVEDEDVLMGRVAAPAAAHTLWSALNNHMSNRTGEASRERH